MTDYDLAATLASGQAFRWFEYEGWWHGVIAERTLRLRQSGSVIEAETSHPADDWDWLTNYLQAHVTLGEVVITFPQDTPMLAAIEACRGLRLLRQEPWECLASFILSSTKQIVQIRQIVTLLCERYGRRVQHFGCAEAGYTFPTAERIAACSEAELRACKMGFRAPYLRGSAQMIMRGEVALPELGQMDCASAREQLLKLPGVGRKIADCVLLFAYGFQDAFPVDVWVEKALQQLYFPKRRVGAKRLRRFSETHFGPYAGYAQQYLFHYMRTKVDS